MPTIQLLNEPLKTRGIRIVQYGDSGVGKSVRASDAARWGLLELHDFDEQFSNLKRYLEANDPARLSQIRAVSYIGNTNAEKIDHLVGRVQQLVANRIAGKTPEIATLVLDSYSTMEQLYAEYICSKYTPSSTGFGSPRTEFEMGKEDIVIPGTMDYGTLAVVMKKFFDALKNTGLNIILNCHAKDPLEQKNRIIRQGTVKAAGQIRDMMPTEFNEWHYLFVDSNSQHRVQAKPTAQWLAKTALPKVPSNGILLDNNLKAFDEIAFKLGEPGK